MISSALHSAESTDQTKVNFAREVLPILSNKCFRCHGPDTKDKDDLRLDSYASAIEDRDGTFAINPKNLAKSEILSRIYDRDNPMPPEDAEKHLTDAEKKILDLWVRQGGAYADHWAFVPPQKAKISEKKLSVSEVIDTLVEKQLKAKGLPFAAEASKSTLARRVSLVLTGLPPELEQLEAYLKDNQPGAYERFVDQLLSNPKYGEHQARYWLDAVRYGDTHGLHLDNRRGIYPYRDWVVHALNKNVPLDQFITWQLAGDLLPNPTLEQRVATGFVRMNPTTAEGGVIPAEFQAKNNFDRVENLGTVLLGMTLNCARCHTHKYDPIPQKEYYQLMAFFNSTAEGPLDGNKYEYGPVMKAPNNQVEWAKWQELQSKLETLTTKLGKLKPESPEQQAAQKEIEATKKSITDLEKTFKASTLVTKDLPKPRVTKILRRGEYQEPIGDALQPGVFSVMGAFPAGEPLNRLGLSKWLTSPAHPLVSRVLLNRIWQRVFGEGLVRTPEDFGLQGEHPTHPELLDWMAVELQESGWDLKQMLRSMVTSKTFKQSSAWRDEIQDPSNRLLARGPSFRLDAEVIRDIALWSSGLMNQEMGGEGVKPHQPPGMWKELAHPASNTKQYVADKDAKVYRRSLYVYWKRTSPHPMLTLFDAPSREASCVRRSRSNTPLQSLGLFNETQRVEMAVKFAERLLTEAKTDQQRLEKMFKLLASRSPNELEKKACEALLQKMKKRYQAAKQDAEQFVSVVGKDSKLDPTEHAAWAQLTTMILASDLAILLY